MSLRDNRYPASSGSTPWWPFIVVRCRPFPAVDRPVPVASHVGGNVPGSVHDDHIGDGRGLLELVDPDGRGDPPLAGLRYVDHGPVAARRSPGVDRGGQRPETQVRL